MKRVSIKTIGCKTNYADTLEVSAHLARRGFRIVEFGEDADLFIVNSCVVTGKAESDSRKALNRCRRINPGGVTILTGCGVNMEGGIDTTPAADLVVPMSAELIAGKVAEVAGSSSLSPSDNPEYQKDAIGEARSRRFVKIQNGCDYLCSYCIVPSVRGRSVSRDHHEVLKDIRSLERAGVPEAVLTGIHIGHYGKDLPGGISLPGLVASILNDTSNIRIRLSSVEVDEVTDDLLHMMTGETRLCNHLHIPLQSGDDMILARMRRWYTAGEYMERVEEIKGKSPDICIGTDVITGFPGETEESFQRTRSYFEALPVDYAHVFSYSPRSGTESAAWDDHVPKRDKKGRTALLRDVAKKKRGTFIDTFLGRTLEVVWEKSLPDNGFAQGTSDNYIKVEWEGKDPLHPVTVPVDIKERNGDRAIGTYRGT